MSAAESFTPGLMRLLAIIAHLKRGERSYQAYNGGATPTTYAVLSGMLAERGLVREVTHRDHTRSHVITKAGRAALRQP